MRAKTSQKFFFGKIAPVSFVVCIRAFSDFVSKRPVQWLGVKYSVVVHFIDVFIRGIDAKHLHNLLRIVMRK